MSRKLSSNMDCRIVTRVCAAGTLLQACWRLAAGAGRRAPPTTAPGV
ncbi:MAG: hypothetical protein WA062_08035 [Rhodoferax sp.]